MKQNKIIHLRLSDLKVGDVFLVHTPFNAAEPITWLAWLIRFFTKNYFNHAAIIDITDNGSILIVQSLEHGVEASFLKDNIIGKDILWLRLDSPYASNSFIINSIKDRIIKGIGIKYDFKGCLLDQLFKQLGEDINPRLDIWIGKQGSKAADRFYCSEFVAWCLDLPKWWECGPDDLFKSPELIKLESGIVNSISNL